MREAPGPPDKTGASCSHPRAQPARVGRFRASCVGVLPSPLGSPLANPKTAPRLPSEDRRDRAARTEKLRDLRDGETPAALRQLRLSQT
jgi:hypothetical protein